MRIAATGVEESRMWHREDGLTFTRQPSGMVEVSREDPALRFVVSAAEWAQVVEGMKGVSAPEGSAMGDGVKKPFETDEQSALWDVWDRVLEYARHAEGCNAPFGPYGCKCGFADVLALPAVRRCWSRGIEVEPTRPAP